MEKFTHLNEQTKQLVYLSKEERISKDKRINTNLRTNNENSKKA